MSHLLKALEGLNPEQAQVVAHQDGALLVASVAGSGKTHAVTVRMGRMVADGVKPERILAVAFSKKAAEEMTIRAQRYANSKQMRVGTFHSVAYEVVRRERPDFEPWTIDEGSTYRFCIKDVVGFKGGPNIPAMKWKDADLSFLEQWIGFAKNALALPGSDKAIELAKRAARTSPGKHSNPQRIMEAYELAELLRKERQILTFDDMLVEAALLLRDEGVRGRWSARYDYLIQDEAQDQCFAMMEIAEAFARDHRNYMMVGDTNQTIYSWRGAYPETFLSFAKEWNAKVIKMVRNYRSGSVIIEAANRVIDAMNPATRMDMTMLAERSAAGEATSLLYEDFDDEADEVSRQILQLKADGVPWSDMVVLYRVNAQSRAPEEALLSKRVPYRILGGTNFYERREVKDLLAYLRAAVGARLTDVSRCINSPSRFLGKKFLERVEARVTALKTAGGPIDWVSLMSSVCDETGVHAGQRSSAQEWAKIIHRIRAAIAQGGVEAKPSRLLDKLVLETGYTQWLVQEEGQESTENNRVSNVRELVRAADRFATVEELLKYIDLTIESSKRNNNHSQPNAVTLMSLHRSKGLEYPVVFLLGCNEMVLPHARGDLDEERRLFYVGVTRAKDLLHVSAVRKAATSKGLMDIAPSRFLFEAHLEPQEPTRTPHAGPSIPQMDDPDDVYAF